MSSRAFYRLQQHFVKQGGKCIWCGVGMFLSNTPMATHEPLRATLEHAYSKFSPLRNESRKLFAACYCCNSTRGRFDVLLRARGIDVSDVWILPDVDRLKVAA